MENSQKHVSDTLTPAKTAMGRLGAHALHWLTLALLALNILATGVLPVRLDSRSMQMTGQMTGPAMLACAQADDGAGHSRHGHKNPPRHTHDTCCIFCLPLMQGVTDLPATTPVPPPSRVVATTYARTYARGRAAVAVLAAFPRGPPSA